MIARNPSPNFSRQISDLRKEAASSSWSHVPIRAVNATTVASMCVIVSLVTVLKTASTFLIAVCFDIRVSWELITPGASYRVVA